MSTSKEEKKATPRNGSPAKTSRKPFVASKRVLEPLDAEAAASLVEAAADVSLVLDRHGVIQDVAIGSEDLPVHGYRNWIGRPWADVVTVESRPKVATLLKDAADGAPRHWRHINHPVERGSDLPLLYSAVRVGQKGRIVAFGRDMRALASLQQRLVDAQHTLERDYWRLRHVETRYRLLFDLSSEAIVIVDAATTTMVEANPAAIALLGLSARKVAGQPFPSGLAEKARRAVATLLARVRTTGRGDMVEVRGAAGQGDLTVTASLFKQETTQLFLVRLASVQRPAAAAAATHARESMAQVIERAPDGFVVTDLDGRVMKANLAFVDLVQLALEDQLRGESLDRWLGRPGVDLSVMLSTLKQQGSVRLFATSLRGEHGALADVEISAVAVPDGDPPCLGFTVRHIGRRLGVELQSAKSAPRSVEQLTQLVGRMPLKDLVRESTDLIEQLCIEAALKLTQDNRASAAEMLGLSRQSLYVKLRRYGLVDQSSEPAGS